MRLFSFLGRQNQSAPPYRRNRHSLTLTTLESRDVPTAWYTVELGSPPEGTLGESVATITGGGLYVNPQYDPDGDGTALVEAHSEAEAIQLVMAGTVTVDLSVVNLPTTTYSSSDMSTNSGSAFAMIPPPEYSSGEWQLHLEDLAAYDTVSDWDYNDWTWDVIVTNTSPTAVDDLASTSLNTPVSIAVLANDSDPDGDPLAVVYADGAMNGTVTFDGTSVTYTPNAGFSGTDYLYYVIDDGNGWTSMAGVNVTVYAQPLVSVDAPLTTVYPAEDATYVDVEYTLRWIGEPPAADTTVTVEYRVTVLGGEDFTNEVWSETRFASFTSSLTSIGGTVRLNTADLNPELRVRIEVVPPAGNNPAFQCGIPFVIPVKALRPKLNGLYVGIEFWDGASVSRTDFERIMVAGKKTGADVRESVDINAVLIAVAATKAGVPGGIGIGDVPETTLKKSLELNKFFLNLSQTDLATFNNVKAKLTLDLVKSVIDQLTDEQINSLRIDAGCIGLVSCYVKTPDQFRKDWIANLKPQAQPEDWYLPGPGKAGVMRVKISALRSQDLATIPADNFFTNIDDAKVALVIDGGTLIAIQGKGTGPGDVLAPGVPNKDSIQVSYEETGFNYLVYFSDSKADTWAYMNAGANNDLADVSNQKVYLIKDADMPAALPDFKATMYVLIP